MCRQLNTFISNDKHLWITLTENLLLSRGIPIVPYRRNLQDALSTDVESWFKCAYDLSNTYRLPITPKVTRWKTELCITWVKIIRGRWCLAAMSNSQESRLCLYDSRSSDGGLLLRCQRYLLGPVMDGELEDAKTEVRIAVSIGATSVSVLFLSATT